MENKKIGKVKATAIILIMLFLVVASFKLQMELNELREEYEQLKAEFDYTRIELDRRTEAKEKLENNPGEYYEQKTYEQGYRKTGDNVYINDMPGN